ncbi:MAG: hypothetical protein GYB31_02420 [Bacteroidetes bacterium]|nr:hypothetical protein [Bacteroidota bacterium]
MSLVQKLKSWLFARKMRQAQLANKTKHLSVNFDSAKTIGLIFEGTNLEQREQVLAFASQLKKEGKKVRMLAFMDNKVDNSGHAFKNFNRNDLDFSLCPKSDEAKNFIGTPLDLLINLSMKSIEPLAYVLASANARFRVGPYDPEANYYELMIDLSKGKKLSDYIKQVEVYLNKMQSTHEAAV